MNVNVHKWCLHRMRHDYTIDHRWLGHAARSKAWLMIDITNYNEAYIDKNVGRGQSWFKAARLHMRKGVYAMVERGLQVN